MRKSPPIGVAEGRVAEERVAEAGEVGAMRRSGSVMLRGAVQFFVLGEPSAPAGTAPAGFLFPAASAE
jgi:hypothetical protein